MALTIIYTSPLKEVSPVRQRLLSKKLSKKKKRMKIEKENAYLRITMQMLKHVAPKEKIQSKLF